MPNSFDAPDRPYAGRRHDYSAWPYERHEISFRDRAQGAG